MMTSPDFISVTRSLKLKQRQKETITIFFVYNRLFDEEKNCICYEPNIKQKVHHSIAQSFRLTKLVYPKDRRNYLFG